MVVVIIFVGFLFVLIGYFVNEKNLFKINTGFSSMTEQERLAFDSKGYVSLLKKCFLTIGFTSITGGLFHYFFVKETYAFVFFTLCISVGLLIFVSVSIKYFKGKKRTQTIFTLVILVLVFGFIGVKIYTSSLPNEIIISDKNIEITGDYGLTFSKREIKEVILLDQLPKIKLRTNGMSLGEIKKGAFKLKNNQMATLFVQSSKGPFVCFKLNTEQQIIVESSRYKEFKYFLNQNN